MKKVLKTFFFAKPIDPVFRILYFPLFRIMGGNGGQPAKEYFKHLCENEFKPLHELICLQNIKLKRLIKEAYENVPYYRKVMDKMHLLPTDINTANDLRRLPILTKAIVRENHNDLINRKCIKGRLTKVTTGGTTGTPMFFLFGKHEIGVKCAHIERWKKVSGVKQFDRYMYIAFDEMAVNRKNYEGTFSHKGFYHMNSFGLNDELLWKYYKNIKKFKPLYLRGQSSACYLLAEFFRRNNLKCPMKVVLTSSDALYPYQRDLIKEVFNCEVYDFYHQAEDVAIGFECGYHNGYHVVMDSCIPEIVAESGEPVCDGQQGTIISTQLENYTMPLIRYDTNDLGSISTEKCACNRNSIKIRQLDGRKADVIITPEGKKIAGGMSRPMKHLHKEIREVQFIQKDVNSIIVRYVPTGTYTAKTQEMFEEKIRELTGKKIQINFEKVQAIPKTMRGKHRLIISEIVEP